MSEEASRGTAGGLSLILVEHEGFSDDLLRTAPASAGAIPPLVVPITPDYVTEPRQVRLMRHGNRLRRTAATPTYRWFRQSFATVGSRQSPCSTGISR